MEGLKPTMQCKQMLCVCRKLTYRIPRITNKIENEEKELQLSSKIDSDNHLSKELEDYLKPSTPRRGPRDPFDFSGHDAYGPSDGNSENVVLQYIPPADLGTGPPTYQSFWGTRIDVLKGARKESGMEG